MKNVVIASAARTPIGSFGGAFKNISAVDLGVIAAKAAIERAKITPEQIDEVYMGCVLSAGLGQNVARQIAIGAGIPYEKPAMTLNIVCGSGLRSVSMAAQMISNGDADIIMCGGAENMSRAPYLNNSQRFGARMGNFEVVDHMIKDGLTDIFNNYHMGITAENIAEKWEISRAEQDLFAVNSQNKAENAQKNGYFDEEIVPVILKERKGEVIVDKDEYIRMGAKIEDLEKLKPAFKKEGTVTAGNASGINDGAAAIIVMSEEKAKELGLEPLAYISGYGTAGVAPEIMGYGPVPATQKALSMAGWSVEDLDLIEANEAFASQSIAVARDLKLKADKVNVNGGAIALGHPIGASGARILTTLLYEMKRRDVKKGLATLCIGGGMGTALLIERK